MKKLLILTLACSAATLLHAQIPTNITIPTDKVIFTHPAATPDMPCNNAGTFVVGPQTGVNTQSNDLTLDTLYLCINDSIFINHNGDFDLTGDPQPSTPAGIGYALYDCLPTVTGPTLQDIVGSAIPPIPGDNCRFVGPPPPINGIYVVSGNPNGDMWFFNSGILQTTYNAGQPFLLNFAPITFDDASNNGFESTAGGFPPGPCVNVNTAAAFQVVYLNPIQGQGVDNSYNGNNCMGRFKLFGGYPQWDVNAQYTTLDISLQGNPNVKALIYTQPSQFKHNTSVIFSVPQPGTYVVTIEDGKSCGASFTIDMGSCSAASNVALNLPTEEYAPQETFCLPITTANMTNVGGFSFSLNWDPTVLELLSGTGPTAPIQNINTDLAGFDPVGNINSSQATFGQVGVFHSDPNGSTVTLTPGEVLFSVCFLAIGQDGDCTDVTFSSDPTLVTMDDATGNALAVTAVDGEVCIVVDTLSITTNVISAGCTNNADVEVRIDGSIAPYEIRWGLLPSGPNFNPVSNIDSTYTIQDLAAGDYYLIVTPENGAGVAETDTVYFTVTIESLGAALNLTNLPLCNGSTDGSVTASVFVGSTVVNPPTGFSFTWARNGSPLAGNGPVQNNANAGTYSVTVTQTATGCTAVASGTLGNPPILDDDLITITPAACTGVNDGTLSYSMEGGTPFPTGGYEFYIGYSTESADPNPMPFDSVKNPGGNPYQNPALYAGFYTIVVVDANGCTFTDEVEVVASRVIDLQEVASVFPSCNGGGDGSISAQVVETPTPPGGSTFTFSWVPASSAITSTGTTSTIDSIPAGSYFLTAVDAAGCSDTLTLTIGEPPLFTVVPIDVRNPTCAVGNDGTITVIGQGGSGLPNTFQYTWDAPAGATGGTISGLVEGTYTVTATDGNGCSAVYDTTIMLPPPPTITGISTTPVRCGSDGEATVNAPTAVTFSWTSSTGNPISTPNSATITGLSGGSYTVVVTDALQCVNTDSIMLAPVDSLVFTDTTLVNPSCFGYNDGSIAIGVAGGNPNYTYAWSPSGTPTPVVLALEAGTYTTTVTDSEGCTLVGMFTLVDPPQIQVAFDNVNPATCFETCDGTTTLITTYLPGSNFNFQWQDGGSTDSLRVDLCAGTTLVTITSNNCFIETPVVIDGPPAVTADTSKVLITDVTCFGGSDGAVSIGAIGGNGAPFTFSWNPPVGATGPVISNQVAGTYVVTITDSQGCTGLYSATVVAPPPVTVAQDPTNSEAISCAGGDNGRIGVTATGGNTPAPGQTPYTYAWTDGTNQYGNTNPLTDLGAGDYTVTVTDVKGCTGTTTISLLDPPAVIGTYQLGDPLKCNGDETSLTVTNIEGGQGGPYTYTLDFGVPLDPAFPSSIGGGIHTLTFLDRFKCETEVEFTVAEPDPIIVTFDTTVYEIQLGESRLVTPIITGAVVDSFIWAPAEFFLSIDTLQPTLYTFESGKFTLTVFDANGCSGMGMALVEVDPNRNVYVPNAFVPGNPQGENDYFNLHIGVGVESVNFMRVYDRWGELLYARSSFVPSESLTEGWDGRYNGKFVEPGVYVYAIEVKFLDGKVLLYRGDVTVVR